MSALGVGLYFLGSAAGASSPAASVRPEVPVTPASGAVDQAQNSPVLAADPTEERFLVLANRIDAPRFGCSVHVSGDGGRSWWPVQPVKQLPEGAERCYAPELAFDRKGRLYFLFVGLQGRGNSPMGTFLVTSDDRARTFTAPRRVLEGENYMVRMDIDPSTGERGRVHLVWLRPATDPPFGGFPAARNPLFASHSDDGGITFSEPVMVSDPNRHRVVAPAVALGRKGEVHVAYFDLQDDARDYQGLEGPVWDGTWSVVVSSSADSGASFGRHVEAATGLVPAERVMLSFTMPPPALVADDRGRVHLAWSDARNGDLDVLTTRSGDSGLTWSEPRRLNDDDLNNGRSQYLPRLALSPKGRLDIIFYDRRDDASNLNNHVSYTFSLDGGRSFAPNLRITGEPSHAETGARYSVPSSLGLVESGSRLALLSRSASAVAAWADTRNVRWKASAQDVFATDVVFPPAARPGTGLPALGLGVAVAGLGAAGALTVRRRHRRHAGPAAP